MKKKIKFLNKKRSNKNDINIASNNSNKKHAKLYIHIIDNNKENNISKYKYLKLKFANIESNLEEAYDNKILLNLDEINIDNDYYYTENISLYDINKNIISEFFINIYFNNINNIYLSLNIIKNSFCFEIYFYTKQIELLPKEIKLLNYNYNMKIYDNFDILYRRRFTIINVDSETLTNYNQNLSFKDYKPYSYQICLRLPNKISIHLNYIKEKKKIEIIQNDSKIQIAKKFKMFKNNISKFLLKIKKYKLSLFIKNFDKDFDNLKNFVVENNFIELDNIKKKYLETFFEELNNINLFDIKIIKLIFHYEIYKYIKSINLLTNLESKIKYNLFKKLFKFVKKYYRITNEIEKLDNFNLSNFDKKNDLFQVKFRILRAITTQMIKLVDKKNIEQEFDYKLIILNKLNNFHCYKKAEEFIKNLIENLNEKSELFDIFLQFNSEISINIKEINCKDVENIIQNPKKFQTSLNSVSVINLLSLNQIKLILNNLIPTIMIRYISKNDSPKYAFLDRLNKITFINEYYLFNEIVDLKYSNDKLEKEENNKYYSLPLSIQIIHEDFCHGSVQQTNGYEIDTPCNTFDLSQDFNYINYQFNEDDQIYGEAGKNLEKHINRGNKYITNYIQRIEYDHSDLLNDITFWTGESFEKLRENIMNKIKEEEKDECNEKYYKYNKFNFLENRKFYKY